MLEKVRDLGIWKGYRKNKLGTRSNKESTIRHHAVTSDHENHNSTKEHKQ